MTPAGVFGTIFSVDGGRIKAKPVRAVVKDGETKKFGLGVTQDGSPFVVEIESDETSGFRL